MTKPIEVKLKINPSQLIDIEFDNLINEEIISINKKLQEVFSVDGYGGEGFYSIYKGDDLENPIKLGYFDEVFDWLQGFNTGLNYLEMLNRVA